MAKQKRRESRKRQAGAGFNALLRSRARRPLKWLQVWRRLEHDLAVYR